MLIQRVMKLALLGSEWVLYVLLGLSVVSIATMVERWLYFSRHRGNAERLRAVLVKRLDKGDVEGAAFAIKDDPSVPARIVREALRWVSAGPEAMADAVDAELSRVRAELERGTNLLGTLGNNAPFVGLFGTVLGVIIAFHSLGASGGNTGAMGGVMAGIAEALVATGVGLFVALPAVIAYNALQKKIGDIEADASSLVKLLSAYARKDGGIVERARVFASNASSLGSDERPSAKDATNGQSASAGELIASAVTVESKG